MKKTLNILLVTYEFPPEMATGGIGSYMFQLANLFHTNGHKVSVISATSKQDFLTTENSFCTNYLIPACSQPDFRKQVLKVFELNIDSATVDIIESPEVGACALEIKKKYPQIPLIVKLHTPGVLITKVSNSYQTFFAKLRFVAGALLRGRVDLGYWSKHDKNRDSDPEYIICKQANIILSPSAALKNWAVSYWGINADKIKLLVNPFVTVDELFQFRIERQTNVICFIGKLTVLKGIFAFTPTIKKLLLKYPHYKVIIAGRDEFISSAIPSMKEWMQVQLKDVEDRIEFTGVLNSQQVNALLGNSDICVVPSLWENYPTIVLEAMAAGCTVAASDAGGIPEIILPQQTGVLFKPKSVSSMFNSVKSLIDNPALRYRLAANARKLLQTKNNRQFIEEAEQVYLSLLNMKTSTLLK